MLEKKIALLTSVTFNNIGNGFIDLGAEAALMKDYRLMLNYLKLAQMLILQLQWDKCSC